MKHHGSRFMGMTSELFKWLTKTKGNLARLGRFFANPFARVLCFAGIAILAGCQATPQPKSRRLPAASAVVQTVKSTQSNTPPDIDDCGLTAYPASRSTQEILAAVPQPSGRSKNSNDLYGKVAIDPDGKVTHLRVLHLAFPEAPKALRDRVNADATDSLKRSRYTPTIVAGKPVASCADVSVIIDMR
jgi:hypothetical protein